MNEITLKLSVNEVNAILLALAKQPYQSVAGLIEDIREQALPQVPEEERNDNKRTKLVNDLAKLVEAEDVGHMPMPK